MAIVYTNNDYGLNMLSYMTQEAEADGVVITDTEAIASGEKDFTAIVSKMRQTEPEAVAYGQLQRSSKLRQADSSGRLGCSRCDLRFA